MEKVRNNKGLSLVELVIAIAMSTVVMGAAAMFLYNADKSYHAAEFSIDVQMEAQIVMEQLANWVMESNHVFVPNSKDAIVLYYIPRNNGRNDEDIYPMGFPDSDKKNTKATRRVIFQGGDKLYMIEDKDIENAEEQFRALVDSGNITSLYTLEDDAIEDNCICEYLYPGVDGKKFSVEITGGLDNLNTSTTDLSAIDKYKVTSVAIALTLKEGVRDFPEFYTIKNTFSIRNGVHETFTSPAESPTPTPDPDI